MHQSFETVFGETAFLKRNKSIGKSIRGHMNADHKRTLTIGLGHVGMYARNPAALAEFYRDVMGMQVVGGSDGTHPLGPTAFLSSRPGEESHEIAIFSNPQLVHQAFRVGSLVELKRFYDKILARGIPIKFQFLHVVSIAFYFHDPEGNLIEVYWRTGLEYPQPCAQEIDLSKTEEELLGALKAQIDQSEFTSSDCSQLVTNGSSASSFEALSKRALQPVMADK
jgi:catechol 2,3-dioxygenase-like lactoylglutathione lyase family enzyme